SALDATSERPMQQAINQLMRDKTCLIIAHRLSTIRLADEILVLEEGKIIERGNHETLMAANGRYKKMVDLQSFME
ncbi:MAG: ABC transporter ATP-binding protein, partial [Bacteroidales bacterium]|nr:ABC transporter ATP-binding protein [Bacteroidales bacterium]